MNPFKLMGWVALALCVVGAFTEIPYSGLLLVLLGLGVGYSIATEDSVRVIVTAVALGTLPAAFNNIPEVGMYLANIFSAGATFVAGGALMMISRNVWNRFKP